MALRRQLVAGGSLAVAVAAAAALVLFVNAAGARFWTRWDLSSAGLYSLSEQTGKVVSGLQRDVRITSFLLPGQGASPDLIAQVRALLDGYRELNPRRVTVEWIDPQRDPTRARALLTEFDLDPLRDSIDIVAVQSGPRNKQVRLADMVEFDFAAAAGGPPQVRSLKVESAITGAILGVTRERKPVVRFASGHGERELGAGDENGLAAFGEALARQDIETQGWDALGASEVPPGTDVVVVAGPRTPWLPNEVEALRRFLAAGGRALVLLDPAFERGAEGAARLGLEPLLESYGLRPGGDVVLDPSRAVPFFGPETLYAQLLGLHPVTSALRDGSVLLVLAQSLARVDPLPGGVAVHALVETSPDAWGETRPAAAEGVARDEADHGGPLGLAFAVQPPEPEAGEVVAPAAAEPAASAPAAGARLVVVGDSEFAANGAIDQLYNRSFALNAVAWLLEEERSLAIPPKERGLARLFLTSEQTATLFVVLVLLFPGLAVSAGVLVWSRRRRAQVLR